MCFSATASFTAGAVLTAAGVITLKHVKRKEVKPLALIPFLFGVQQLVEGFVWLSIAHSWTQLNFFATHGFVFFSNIVWPILVPFAVLSIEKAGWRRSALLFCSLVGGLVGVYSFLTIVQQPIQSQISCNSVHYLFTPIVQLPTVINIAFYFIATCLSCLLSSHKLIKIFGICAVTFLAISLYFYTVTFVSVWCFFSAILSLIIYYFVKNHK